MRNQSGFTLVEVMISMLIMAMLTVLVSSSIRTAVQNKKKLEAKMAREALLYDSLRLIKLDLERAFHYRDVFYEIENLAIKKLNNEKRKDETSGDTSQLQQRPPPVQLTHFIGNNNSMHFTALNHFRTKYNAQESDQMEVGYFVDSCEKPNGKGDTQCLWRRTNPQIDDKVDEDGPRVVVAHFVKEFSLLYHNDQEEDDWFKDWRSDRKGRPQHQKKFPDFVKIKLVIHDTDDKKDKPIEQAVVVRINFPNNVSPLQSQNQDGGLGQPQQRGNFQ